MRYWIRYQPFTMKKRMTIILVSHSMEDIARYADRIMVMSHGEKLFDAPPKEVFGHYKELEEIGLGSAPDYLRGAAA